MSIAQVKELVDSLVERGALHSLALHGVSISLVTRRDWLLRQFSRLTAINLHILKNLWLPDVEILDLKSFETHSVLSKLEGGFIFLFILKSSEAPFVVQ